MLILPRNIFFTILNVNFRASSLNIRSPSTGNVWNISTSTRIPQTCHLICDNWQTKGAQLSSRTFRMVLGALWRYPYWWWEHYPSLAILLVVTQNFRMKVTGREHLCITVPILPFLRAHNPPTQHAVNGESSKWTTYSVRTWKGNPILLVLVPACKAAVWCHYPTLQNTLVNNETQHCILQQKE